MVVIWIHYEYLVSSSLTIKMAGGGDTIQLFKITKQAYQDIGLIAPPSN